MEEIGTEHEVVRRLLARICERRPVFIVHHVQFSCSQDANPRRRRLLDTGGRKRLVDRLLDLADPILVTFRRLDLGNLLDRVRLGEQDRVGTGSGCEFEDAQRGTRGIAEVRVEDGEERLSEAVFETCTWWVRAGIVTAVSLEHKGVEAGSRAARGEPRVTDGSDTGEGRSSGGVPL